MGFFHSTVDKIHEKEILKSRDSHWKARLIVSLILLGCSILGVIVTDFAPAFAWSYWLYMVPIFAVLCIWLTWLVSRNHDVAKITIWHEVLHWLGLLGAVFVVSFIVETGVISYMIGGLFVLILLALTLFLAGVHFDSMYLLLGFVLGLMAFFAVFLVKYLAVILIPIIILAALILIWRYTHLKKTSNDTESAPTPKSKNGDDEL